MKARAVNQNAVRSLIAQPTNLADSEDRCGVDAVEYRGTNLNCARRATSELSGSAGPGGFYFLKTRPTGNVLPSLPDHEIVELTDVATIATGSVNLDNTRFGDDEYARLPYAAPASSFGALRPMNAHAAKRSYDTSRGLER